MHTALLLPLPLLPPLLLTVTGTRSSMTLPSTSIMSLASAAAWQRSAAPRGRQAADAPAAVAPVAGPLGDRRACCRACRGEAPGTDGLRLLRALGTAAAAQGRARVALACCMAWSGGAYLRSQTGVSSKCSS